MLGRRLATGDNRILLLLVVAKAGGVKLVFMGRIQISHRYQDIISIDNLLEAWREFLNGKRSRKDVQHFELNLMGNILTLHRQLASLIYKHSAYQAFNISDPKPRSIHKAKVRDRLLHHAIYRDLYPIFDRVFIAHSYSCRKNKGTHKAVNVFREMAFKASSNHTKTLWVLKCDVRKFFASVDHAILARILAKHISDKNLLWLLGRIVRSFHSTREGVGLPLGNLTSQLLVNVYMNEFDKFVKHQLKEKYYIRYADDFVVMSTDKIHLERLITQISKFLGEELCLELHPDKVYIKTIASGVDFLGWVNFYDHRVLRKTTKRRVFKKVSRINLSSYVGLLKHGNTYRIRERLGL